MTWKVCPRELYAIFIINLNIRFFSRIYAQFYIGIGIGLSQCLELQYDVILSLEFIHFVVFLHAIICLTILLVSYKIIIMWLFTYWYLFSSIRLNVGLIVLIREFFLLFLCIWMHANVCVSRSCTLHFLLILLNKIYCPSNL